MGYREPGVYSEIVNAVPNTGFTPALIPVIIGEGPSYLDHTDIPIVRASTGSDDILPATTVTAISKVYKIVNGAKTTISSSEYTLIAPNKISWQVDAANKPAAGATYYADFEARPESIQYSKSFITSFDQLATAYGGQLMKTASGGAATAINPVYLGAYLALESGAPGVYVIQVEPADTTNYTVAIATDIVGALEKASFITDAYYVVPMTSDSTAVGAAITHCTVMSGIEERKERVCFVSMNVAVPEATSGIFSTEELDTAISKVSSLADKRVRVPFITKATKTLSDGTLYSLGAEYICAALAGLSAVLKPQTALTRQKLMNFVELKHVVNLSRPNKNKLAAAGFIILEQNGGVGAPVVIRHGVTTKMDNVADREISVVTAADYTAKYLRSTLEGYIGIHTINSFLVTKVSGSITACRNTLVRAGNLNDLQLKDVKQDADNPDSLLVGVRMAPAYPCNYIDLQILLG